MTPLSTERFSCSSFLRMAQRWIIEGQYTALAKAAEPTSEQERIRMLCEEVERINRAVPVNNGRPAILGQVAP